MGLNDFLGKLSTLKLGKLKGKLGLDATFDYVIVGGGTAGIPLAVRLAQNGNSVALVEAGHHYEISHCILGGMPGGDVILVGADPDNAHPFVDWKFVAKDQPGVNNRPIHFARGKCFGGSSALNFMIYQRPTVQSCEQWADAVGDESYTFDNLMPYYQKSVQFTPPNMEKRGLNRAAMPKYDPDAFSKTGGPLKVSYTNYSQPFSEWLGPAFEEIGMKEALDFNTGSLTGYQYCTSTIHPVKQFRSSSETSFLKMAVKTDLEKLKVYGSTLTNKVLFDRWKRAIGVEVRSGGGRPYTLYATKEVVLCAGAFQSPHLLMLSGIGPEEELEKHGINVVVNLPGVGENMWDHPTFGPTFPVKVDTLTKLVNDPVKMMKSGMQFYLKHEGVLTNPVADWLGWEKIPEHLRTEFTPSTTEKLAEFPLDWPEVEYISGAGFVGSFSNLPKSQPADNRNYATILTVLIAPLSRGNVKLASKNPADLPIINPNWLDDPADQEVAIAAYKRAREAFHSKAMSPIIDGPEAYPGEAVRSDEAILEAIRNSLITLWHPGCTCKMGKDDDPMAVLDSRARVRGVTRLRVVDASSFPFLPPGHPQSSCYMLAEKIADDMIKSF